MFYTIEELLASFHSETGSQSEAAIHTQWVFQALMDIKVWKLADKTCDLPVEDCMISKPLDYVAYIGLSMYNEAGTCIGRPVVGKVNEQCCELIPTNCNRHFRLEEQEAIFLLSSSLEEVHHVILEYYGLPLNEAGSLLIPQEVFEACLAYLNWKYLTQQRNKYRTAPRYPAVVSPAEVTDARAYYTAKRQNARTAVSNKGINGDRIREIGHRLIYKFDGSWPAPPETMNARYIGSPT